MNLFTDSEVILKVLCDSLKYPEFNNAFENLNQFEQRELMQILDDILNNVYKEGYEDSEEENKYAYNVGYDNGESDAVNHICDVIEKFFDNDLETRDKLLGRITNEG